MDVLIYIVVLAAVFVLVYIMTRRVFRLSNKVREQAREILDLKGGDQVAF